MTGLDQTRASLLYGQSDHDTTPPPVFGLDAGWRLNGRSVRLQEVLTAPGVDRDAVLRVAIRAMARRWRWRSWVEPGQTGWTVVAPAPRRQTKRVAFYGQKGAAIDGCIAEIHAARRREQGGRW